jgi:hypothetical protein
MADVDIRRSDPAGNPSSTRAPTEGRPYNSRKSEWLNQNSFDSIDLRRVEEAKRMLVDIQSFQYT